MAASSEQMESQRTPVPDSTDRDSLSPTPLTRRQLREREAAAAVASVTDAALDVADAVVAVAEAAIETRRQRRERERAAAHSVSTGASANIPQDATTMTDSGSAAEVARAMGEAGRAARDSSARDSESLARPSALPAVAPAAARPAAPRPSAPRPSAPGPSAARPPAQGPATARPVHTHKARRKSSRVWFKTVVVMATAGITAAFCMPAYAQVASAGAAEATTQTQPTGHLQSLTVAQVENTASNRGTYSVQENAKALISTTQTTVSPTVQALAAKLMADVAAGRLIGSTPNHIPEIQNLANGWAVPNCGVDFRVLQAIDVAVQNFGVVGVSDINRLCTGQIEGAGTASPHYVDGGGHAVDFYILNGHALTGRDSDSIKLLRILDPLVPPGSDVGQEECGASVSLQNFVPFDDSCTHLHVDFINAKGASLKI